jgi:uncharacterized protein (TIGR00288 family)
MNYEHQPLLAVLIDADNINAKHAQAILNEIKGFGEPALRRVYGDWRDTGLSAWTDQARELGLVTRQATANSKHKNASDIELVIDAMDLLREERFDGFVLVSGDSDFTALGNRLREHGKTVIGIGREDSASASFINICNRYIFVENIEKDMQVPSTASNPPKKAGLGPAFQQIHNAMRKLDPDGEWFALSVVGHAVVTTFPDFDPRTYGHTKLSKLIEEIPKLELRTEGDMLQVRLKP